MLIMYFTLLSLFHKGKPKYAEDGGGLHGPMQASRMVNIAALDFNSCNS